MRYSIHDTTHFGIGVFRAGFAQLLIALGLLGGIAQGNPDSFRASLLHFTCAKLVALDGLLPADGPGWVLVDSSAAFPEPMMREIYQTLPKPSVINLTPRLRETRGSVIVGDRVTGFIPDELLTQLDHYIMWCTDLINQKLPVGQRVEFLQGQLRVSQKGGEAVLLPEWHADGMDFAAVTPLLGFGPDFRRVSPEGVLSFGQYEALYQGCADFERTPRGQTLFMTGHSRVNCEPGVRPTAHRTPPNAVDSDRMLLVLRWGRNRL